MKNYLETVEFIKDKIKKYNPKIAVILGSGLGVFSDEFEEKVTLSYKDIPGFPVSTVEGHAGELIIGILNGIEIIAMNGRFHYYEGYALKETTYPEKIFKLLGIETLIITNAAGGINLTYKAGDFMVISDHLSFFAESVLRGKNENEFGDRFPDMSNIYNKELREKLKPIVKKYVGRVQEGIYGYMKGPTFETPAEIRALRLLGADSVGMSTVPEAIVANHCGIKVCGISCITNMAAGITDETLSYKDIKETADRVKNQFKEIIKEFITVI